MKKLLLTLFIALGASMTFAQAPQRMSYQAVVRDPSGNLVTSTNVGVQFSILQGTVTGPSVFTEWAVVASNVNGLITYQIGSTATMNIDWSAGPYFMQVEIDPNGGTNFTTSAVSQLLSVPYAMYAETADYNNLTNAPTNVSAFVNDAGYITSGGAGNTLDGAYDEGGAGVGAAITADTGPVQINASGSTTTAMEVNTAVSNSTGYLATHSGVGVGFRAESTNPANTFSAIQANTNSSNALNSAILGNNTGAGYGVSGQVQATATGTAGVYGNNLRTTGGYGVYGQGLNGVVGESVQPNGYGVYGSNSGTTGLSIGTYGIGFNGVYGQTTNVTTGWSGYFTADVGVDGTGYSVGGWITVSDRRLKTDIVPIENALEKIAQLSGKHYTLHSKVAGLDGKVTAQTQQQYGVIAQDVEALFPDMVREKAVFSNTGDMTEYKTVSYDQLVPVLIESIKELKDRVEELEAQVEESK